MATKLPLTVRKDIRDQFDAKKAELEQDISTILGTPWTIEVDFLMLFNDAVDGWPKERTGSMVYEYMSNVKQEVQKFAENLGTEGKDELNMVAAAHKITMAQDNAKPKKVSYCGPSIKDGALVILYAPKELGTNVSYCCDGLAAAVNEAGAANSAGSMSFAARSAVKDYEKGIEEILEKAQKALNLPGLKLNPNFEANYAMLKKNPKDLSTNWENRFGNATLGYFENFAGNLVYEGFEGDDMMQEGFADECPSSEVVLRIVDKLKTSSNYIESVIEEGVCYLQTIPSKWDVNTGEAGRDLKNIL